LGPSGGRTPSGLEHSLADIERRLILAEAYDAAENVADARSYFADEEGRSRGAFTIDQTMQPMIRVAPDGRSATLTLRVLQAGGRAGEDGWWTAGVYDGEAVNDHGVWKLKTMTLERKWRAGYRTGWSMETQ
jgi:hypothetical protein